MTINLQDQYWSVWTEMNEEERRTVDRRISIQEEKQHSDAKY